MWNETLLSSNPGGNLGLQASGLVSHVCHIVGLLILQQPSLVMAIHGWGRQVQPTELQGTFPRSLLGRCVFHTPSRYLRPLRLLYPIAPFHSLQALSQPQPSDCSPGRRAEEAGSRPRPPRRRMSGRSGVLSGSWAFILRVFAEAWIPRVSRWVSAWISLSCRASVSSHRVEACASSKPVFVVVPSSPRRV